jgi:hypothetical protein
MSLLRYFSFSPATTYDHSASMSSGFSWPRHGGIAFLPLVNQAHAPDRNQPLHVGCIDLLERTVVLQVIAYFLVGIALSDFGRKFSPDEFNA